MLTPLIVRLPADLVRRLKHHAIDRDESIQAVVTEAIRAHLGREGRR